MRVVIRSGDTDVEDIGNFATYGEALAIALQVLRRLEILPRSNRLNSSRFTMQTTYGFGQRCRTPIASRFSPHD